MTSKGALSISPSRNIEPANTNRCFADGGCVVGAVAAAFFAVGESFDNGNDEEGGN
jgi:hypothetical protein